MPSQVLDTTANAGKLFGEQGQLFFILLETLPVLRIVL